MEGNAAADAGELGRVRSAHTESAYLHACTLLSVSVGNLCHPIRHSQSVEPMSNRGLSLTKLRSGGGGSGWGYATR